jgi:tetratricopeptide (TPR) repeat protein
VVQEASNKIKVIQQLLALLNPRLDVFEPMQFLTSANEVLKKGKYLSAIYNFERYLKFSANSVQNVNLNILYLNLATCYEICGSTQLANLNYQRAFAVAQSVNSYCRYGLFLFNCNKLGDAIDVFKQAILGQNESKILFNIEKNILDLHLQKEVSKLKNIEIRSVIFARYMLIKCYKMKNETDLNF